VKSKILLSAAIWLCLISTAHVWLNVGFGSLGHKVQVMMGKEKPVLQVGFLPVT
jgi:hypothetical protein